MDWCLLTYTLTTGASRSLVGEGVLGTEGYFASALSLLNAKILTPDFHVLKHCQISEGTEDSQRKCGFLEGHFLGNFGLSPCLFVSLYGNDNCTDGTSQTLWPL